jgi:hypothetical protein
MEGGIMSKLIIVTAMVLLVAQTVFGSYAYIDCYGPVGDGLVSYNVYLWADPYYPERKITGFNGSISGPIHYSDEKFLDTHFLLDGKATSYISEGSNSLDGALSLYPMYQSKVITLAQVVTSAPEYGPSFINFSISGIVQTSDGKSVGVNDFILSPPISAAIGYKSKSVDVGQRLNLDANNSYCSEHSIDSYRWDLDNDGLFDDASGATLNLDHDYLVTGLGLSPGEHIIRLRVQAGNFICRNYAYITIVPEPMSLLLIISGGLFLCKRR